MKYVEIQCLAASIYVKIPAMKDYAEPAKSQWIVAATVERRRSHSAVASVERDFRAKSLPLSIIRNRRSRNGSGHFIATTSARDDMIVGSTAV